MSRHARDIRSRLSEYRDHAAEYAETRDPKAGVRMHRAMRKLDDRSFVRAQEDMVSRNVDQHEEDRRRLKEIGYDGFKIKATEEVVLTRKRRSKHGE